MTDGIKLSVIIPARNAGSTIGRAIESIKSQGVEPHEVIVVDNGSTDNTAHEAAQRQDSLNIKLLSCSTPGSGAARNTGIKAAEGDCIAFLDADDVWYPTKIESQLDQVADKTAAFSGTFMHYLSPSGRILGNNVRFKDDSKATQALRTASAMPVPLSSVLVSKALIEQVGLFNESFRRAQDLEWLTRIAAIADLSIPTRLPLVGYVLQAGSSSDDSYIEQGLAADAVRAGIKSGRAPDYERDVVSRLKSSAIPRKYKAGKHYRRAGALFGQGKALQASIELLQSTAIDPVGTLTKLRWQSVGTDAGTLDPATASLFEITLKA